MKKIFQDPGSMHVINRIRFMEHMERGDREDRYGAIFRFSYSLATTIQLRVAEGMNFETAAIKSIKEVSEKFADEEVHVSSTMKGQAVEILEEVWSRGKDLSVWFKLFSKENPTLL